MAVINILKTKTLEEQKTYFNQKHHVNDNFAHSVYMRNGTLLENEVKKL